jgi:Flp pilus assembly pilin Flp
MNETLLWLNRKGANIVEYAILMAVILVVTVSSLRILGINTGESLEEVVRTLGGIARYAYCLLLRYRCGHYS